MVPTCCSQQSAAEGELHAPDWSFKARNIFLVHISTRLKMNIHISILIYKKKHFVDRIGKIRVQAIGCSLNHVQSVFGMKFRPNIMITLYLSVTSFR